LVRSYDSSTLLYYTEQQAWLTVLFFFLLFAVGGKVNMLGVKGKREVWAL
jgi:hypothetical protein